MNTSACSPERLATIGLLGVQLNPLTLPALNALVRHAIERGQRCIVGNHNLHSVHLYHADAEMREFYGHASAIHIDGMPLILLGRLLGYPLRREQRVTYVDWIGPLMRAAAGNGWRVFYLGSPPGVAARGATILRERHAGLRIATASGYFDPDGPQNDAVLAAIADFRPHILMVGMGMPRQERWILRNLPRLPAGVVLPCGACIDYVAGASPTPPRWAGRMGLEWLFRLGSEPARLWRRYLVEPWSLVPLLTREWLVGRSAGRRRTWS